MAAEQSAFDRRTFLRLMAAGTGGWLGLMLGVNRLSDQAKIDSTFKIKFDEFDPNNYLLSFEEASQLTKRLDAVYDSLPNLEIEPTTENLQKLALEIIPQFEQEGLTVEAQWPNTVGFKFFSDGNSANHVLGRSDCSTYAIENGRISLDTSSWYGNDMVFTLIHELAHVAQTKEICSNTPTDLIENSAQIGALEVCAGLANQGNKYFFGAFVDELRGMAMSSAYAVALRNGQFEEFHELRNNLSPGAMSEAKFQKSRRRWSEDPGRLMEILEWYNLTPVNLVVRAIRDNDAKIDGLAFPPVTYDGSRGYMSYTALPRTIKLDDTRYLLQNLEGIASEIVKEEK